MALQTFQTEIQLNTLYRVRNSGRGRETEDSSIEAIGGTINIFGSTDESVPTPPTGMAQTAANFSGIDVFDFVPTFLYVTGTATKIILTQISAVEVV